MIMTSFQDAIDALDQINAEMAKIAAESSAGLSAVWEGLYQDILVLAIDALDQINAEMAKIAALVERSYVESMNETERDAYSRMRSDGTEILDALTIIEDVRIKQ